MRIDVPEGPGADVREHDNEPLQLRIGKRRRASIVMESYRRASANRNRWNDLFRRFESNQDRLPAGVVVPLREHLRRWARSGGHPFELA